MSETAVETIEAPQFDARENRKYASRKLAEAQNELYGRHGMTKDEKVAALKSAAFKAAQAYTALEKAIAQVEAEPEKVVEYAAPVTPDVDKFAEPEEYSAKDADEDGNENSYS